MFWLDFLSTGFHAPHVSSSSIVPLSRALPHLPDHIAVISTFGTRWSELSICLYWNNPLGYDVWQSGRSEVFCSFWPHPLGRMW